MKFRRKSSKIVQQWRHQLIFTYIPWLQLVQEKDDLTGLVVSSETWKLKFPFRPIPFNSTTFFHFHFPPPITRSLIVSKRSSYLTTELSGLINKPFFFLSHSRRCTWLVLTFFDSRHFRHRFWLAIHSGRPSFSLSLSHGLPFLRSAVT